MIEWSRVQEWIIWLCWFWLLRTGTFYVSNSGSFLFDSHINHLHQPTIAQIDIRCIFLEINKRWKWCIFRYFRCWLVNKGQPFTVKSILFCFKFFLIVRERINYISQLFVHQRTERFWDGQLFKSLAKETTQKKKCKFWTQFCNWELW